MASRWPSCHTRGVPSGTPWSPAILAWLGSQTRIARLHHVLSSRWSDKPWSYAFPSVRLQIMVKKPSVGCLTRGSLRNTLTKIFASSPSGSERRFSSFCRLRLGILMPWFFFAMLRRIKRFCSHRGSYLTKWKIFEMRNYAVRSAVTFYTWTHVPAFVYCLCCSASVIRIMEWSANRSAVTFYTWTHVPAFVYCLCCSASVIRIMEWSAIRSAVRILHDRVYAILPACVWLAHAYSRTHVTHTHVSHARIH